MKQPGIVIGATASGSGKTLITCGLMQALVNRGLKVASFKCGPDYIDPMFHRRVIGTKARNLDCFFTTPEMTRYLYEKNSIGCDIAVIEGVMGYYDGLGGVNVAASTYDVARVTESPAILVVDCKGMSLSAAAYVKGFLSYKADSRIAGVILNRVSGMLYPALKAEIEKELTVKVLGYLPKMAEVNLASRHLGLLMPDEIPCLREALQTIAEQIEKTIEVDQILELADQRRAVGAAAAPVIPKFPKPVRIAVAKDEAFCFLYDDNLELLMEMGARIEYFSPLHDRQMPAGIDGILLPGGYPELYARELSQNTGMKQGLCAAIKEGKFCLAECGGFMYLHTTMEDLQKQVYPMLDVVEGAVYKTDRLQRFGYMELKAKAGLNDGDSEWIMKGHEFHYFESTAGGTDYIATKPVSGWNFECMYGGIRGIWGFPHLYYYSNIDGIYQTICKCMEGNWP